MKRQKRSYVRWGFDGRGWRSMKKKDRLLMWELTRQFRTDVSVLVRQYVAKHPRVTYAGAVKALWKESNHAVS